ncbi:MAG: energy transducer TonB [bacterium]|nr:energy transducer TonB [bacterium]
MTYLQAEAFSLKKALTISLLIHFLVILYIVFEPRLFPSPAIPLIPVYRVNLVSLPAPPAPEVVTPSPTVEAPAPVPPAPPVQAAPPVKAAPPVQAAPPVKASPKLHSQAVKKSPASTRPAKKTAAAKTAAAKAKDSFAKSLDHSRELGQAIASIKKNLIEKIESQTESDLVVLNPSAGSENSDPEFQRYLEGVSRKIKSAWAYPAAKPRQQLIVSIKIRADGQVTDAKIEKSSLDQAYDASALRALQKANPLPPLPSLRYGRILEIGLRF